MPMTLTDIMERVREDYPAFAPSHAARIQLGLAMRDLGFQSKRDERGMLYFALPKTS